MHFKEAKRLSSSVNVTLSTPLWLYWAEIAIANEKLALGHRASRDIVSETKDAMVAISASAHAIDGFYGRFRDIVVPAEIREKWQINRERGKAAPRPNQLLETLKRGFKVKIEAWRSDFEWLFEVRNAAVHFEEASKDTAEHPGLGGGHTSQDRVTYSLEPAGRAISLMLDVLDNCTASPKPAAASACKAIREHVEALVRSRVL
jgi:hypothetical protein